jgi:asparagine synthase (glutamine-hydrolysing)
MCGIAGIASWSAAPNLKAEIANMIAPIHHRGPDDFGIWCDDAAGIGLGQRRLSIIDLSEHGHQPMQSASGRWMLSYNGEIYNFEALRQELAQAGKAPAWRGHSDTEVLLACIEAWGTEAALKKLTGMFAISLWDREERTLTLARDRFGEKPLYYGVVNGRLYFASELKAIVAVAGPLEIDREALSDFFSFSYVPAPKSIWQGIRKLPPAHYLVLRSADGAQKTTTPFWTMGGDDHAALRAEMASASSREITDRVEAEIRRAVSDQMVSDVPLGAFLSGGVDSSVVVALMQQQSSRPVRTFTIGFDDPAMNEAPFAAEVAKHLGTDHTELYVTGKDAEQLIPEMPHVYDEPFADSSQIPTTLVSRLTRKHVTVSLSGDGGDELFAGYPRYFLTRELWRKTGAVPYPLRKVAASLLNIPSPAAWDVVTSAVVPKARQQTINGHRLHRLAQMIQTKSIGEMYLRLMSRWQPEDAFVLGLPPQNYDFSHWDDSIDPVEAMRRWDLAQYMPDDLMVKVDRAAMSTSLETRAPLLDHRLAELALALPERELFKGQRGKLALRNVLYRYVPQALIERPKAGFGIPLGDWLRGPLRDWADTMLDPTTLRAQGLINADAVATLWREHISEKYDRGPYLWNVLMFQAWYADVKSAG